jgi:CDP-6-deoxy-D-xylo-4-hexulose-3-dehydrase
MNSLTKHRKFKAGKEWAYYAPNTKYVFGKQEIAAVNKVLKKGWLGTGDQTTQFEAAVAKLFGKKYGVFVNSGSSANLLSLQASRLPKGAEVITPSCTFNTTIAPIVQSGLVPVLVDVKVGEYVLDTDQLEAARSEKTVAVKVPHLIGNFADMKKIRAFCDKYKLLLIEDSCDTIGGLYAGKPSGIYSDITTTSFYASHIITAGGAGGMVMSDDPELIKRVRVFASWGRGLRGYTESIKDRLAAYEIDGKPYDSAFVFVEQGYNFRPTEIQAAFGLAQLKRLPSFTKHRRWAFESLYTFFSRYKEYFILPIEQPKSKTQWLAFPLTIRPEAPFTRNEFVTYLEHHKIQTRPLFAGNVVKHIAYHKSEYRVIGELPHSQNILHNSFLIGAHHTMTQESMLHTKKVIEDFIKNLTF